MSSPFGEIVSKRAVAVIDSIPFWKRHLRAQLRLYAGAGAQGGTGRPYRSAVVWGLTTFLSALGECQSEDDLRRRAGDTTWWNAMCRAELHSASLVELRIGEVPISGHSLSQAALALRYLELTQRLAFDSTTVLDTPPPQVLAWMREE